MSELDRLLKKSTKQIRKMASDKKIPYYTKYDKEALIKMMYPNLALSRATVEPKKQPKHLAKIADAKKDVYTFSVRYITEVPKKANPEKFKSARVGYEVKKFEGSFKGSLSSMMFMIDKKFKGGDGYAKIYKFINSKYPPPSVIDNKSARQYITDGKDNSPRMFSTKKTAYYSSYDLSYKMIRAGKKNILDIPRGLKRLSYVRDEPTLEYSCMIDALVNSGYKLPAISKQFPDYQDKDLRITSRQLINFCEERHGHVHLLDLFSNTVYKTPLDIKPSHHLKVLTGYLNHEHITLITDNKQKKSLSLTNNKIAKKRHFDATVPDEVRKIDKTIHSEKSKDLINRFIEYITVNNVPLQDLKLKFSGGHLNQMETPNDLFINMEKRVLDMMSKVHGKPNIDTPGSMGSRLFRQFVGSNIDKFTGHVLPNLQHTLYNLNIGPKHYKFTGEAVKAIDQNKSYSSILRTIRNFRPHVLSTICKVNINQYTSIDDIHPGLYWVNTNDLYLFRGNGQYTDLVLKKAISDHIPFQCDHWVDFEATLTPIFDDFVTEMHTKYEQYIGGKLINHFIGTCNRHEHESIKTTVSYDPYDILYLYNKYDATHDIDVRIFNAGDKELYMINKKTSVSSIKTMMGIYIEVINNSYIHNYNMMKKIGLENIAYISTDCLGINKDIDVSQYIGTEPGQYKYENVKIVDNEVLPDRFPISIPNQYIKSKSTWEPIDDLVDNCLVLGEAGTGKTTLIQNYLANKPKVFRLAPTNLAARIINGSTIHSFFNNHFHSLSSAQISQLNDSILWVDEASMLDRNMYQVLFLVKTETTAKIILSGDFRQLRPVDDNLDYENSDLLKYICDKKLLTLTEIHRYDFDYNKVFINYASVDTLLNMNEPRAIVVTNKMRHILTDQILYHKYGVALTDVHYTTQAYYRVGMPLVCKENKREVHYNNVPYTVTAILPGSMIELTNDLTNKSETYNSDYVWEHFDFRFAVTTYKSQGQTYNHPYMIFESERMTPNHRYVAVTRARKLAMIINAK